MDLRKGLSSLSVSPQKILKIVISLSFVLLLLWLFILWRMDYEPSERLELSSNSGQTEQKRQVIANSGEVSKQYPKAQKVAEKTNEVARTEKDSGSGMFGNAFVTFLFLIVLLAGIWYWSDRNNGRLDTGVDRILGTQTLGEGVTLKIIKINQEVWVLGVTSQSVKLLHRYNENEWNEELPVQKMKQENFMETFKKKLS